ncbi:LamG domain-containing protein [Pyxidicoccus sp. 3LG]
MARAFDITTTSPTLKLDGSRRSEVAFTVTNALGRPVRGRAVVVPDGPMPPEWFSVEEAERDFPPSGTHVYQVKVAVPPAAPPKDHSFHLLVVDQANPDEHFAEGPTVSFHVPAPVVVPKKRIPWWIPVSAAAAILIIVLVGVLWGRGEDEEPATGGSGPVAEPAEPPPPAPVLTFNGSTSYVDLGQPLSLEITGPITMEAWVRPTNPSTVQDIVARGFTINPSGEIYLRIAFQNFQVGSYMDGKGFGGVNAQMPVQDLNRWVHVAGVFDGEKWKLYRNGELLAESPHPGGGGMPINARWAIGSKGGGGADRAFNGNIRDVRIWSIARTQDQIRDGMNDPPKKDEDGLAGFWPMEEGKSRRIVDHSGNEAHGFVHDAQWGPSPQ